MDSGLPGIHLDFLGFIWTSWDSFGLPGIHFAKCSAVPMVFHHCCFEVWPRKQQLVGWRLFQPI